MSALSLGIDNEVSCNRRDRRKWPTVMGGRNMQGFKQAMLDAISSDEFFVVYQPQAEITGNSVIGIEALLRWNSARFGCVSPAEFIPVAEDLNLISEIGEIVIRKSCEQLSRWKTEYKSNIRLAINVSCMQAHSYRVIETFEHYLELNGLKPSDLEIELTESTLIKDKTKVINILNEFRSMGIRTAIDDFGTGYSSLSHLASMPFDLLKIDRSFINKLGIDNAHTTITRSIIQMAKSLEMEVLAEGVETELQKKILEDNMCDLIQGNLISVPVSADKIPVLTGMCIN